MVTIVTINVKEIVDRYFEPHTVRIPDFISLNLSEWIDSVFYCYVRSPETNHLTNNTRINFTLDKFLDSKYEDSIVMSCTMSPPEAKEAAERLQYLLDSHSIPVIDGIFIDMSYITSCLFKIGLDIYTVLDNWFFSCGDKTCRVVKRELVFNKNMIYNLYFELL